MPTISRITRDGGHAFALRRTSRLCPPYVLLLVHWAGKGAAKTADVMLRYNFPGAGLADDALRTLILLVLDTGAEIRRSLTA